MICIKTKMVVGAPLVSWAFGLEKVLRSSLPLVLWYCDDGFRTFLLASLWILGFGAFASLGTTIRPYSTFERDHCFRSLSFLMHLFFWTPLFLRWTVWLCKSRGWPVHERGMNLGELGSSHESPPKVVKTCRWCMMVGCCLLPPICPCTNHVSPFSTDLYWKKAVLTNHYELCWHSSLIING